MIHLNFFKKNGEFDVKAFAKDWVAALRSGKYKQGDGQLRSSAKYCCLGVACDRLRMAGIGKWSDDTFIVPGKFIHTPKNAEEFGDDYLKADLSLELREKIQLEEEVQSQLVDLNDGGDEDETGNQDVSTPFPLIADMIETYYKSIGVL